MSFNFSGISGFAEPPSFMSAGEQMHEFSRIFTDRTARLHTTYAYELDCSAVQIDALEWGLAREKQKIISGFLNLGESHGWVSGSTPILGQSFSRYLLVNYFKKNYCNLNRSALEKLLESFQIAHILAGSANYGRVNPKATHRPKNGRVCYDAHVQGWKGHLIGRLVGNLASEYGATKPCFEIIVNSQRSRLDICRPFTISIHVNEAEILKRRQGLLGLEQAPQEIAYPLFYSSSLVRPEDFLARYQDKIGPNSKRILDGLIFMEKIEMPAQSVGNCWMKQPMRTLLASLYLEIYSERKELTPDQAWTEAKKIYKEMQVNILDFIGGLINKTEMTPEMERHAREAFERRKSLLSQ